MTAFTLIIYDNLDIYFLNIYSVLQSEQRSDSFVLGCKKQLRSRMVSAVWALKGGKKRLQDEDEG